MTDPISGNEIAGPESGGEAGLLRSSRLPEGAVAPVQGELGS
jgi:hypothetical protein